MRICSLFRGAIALMHRERVLSFFWAEGAAQIDDTEARRCIDAEVYKME